MKVTIEVDISPQEIPAATELFRALRLLSEQLRVRDPQALFRSLVSRLGNPTQLDAVAADITTMLQHGAQQTDVSILPSSSDSRATTLSAVNGEPEPVHEEMLDAFISAFMEVTFDPEVLLKHKTIFPFMQLLPKLPLTAKQKIGTVFVPKVLKQLMMKRPIDADRKDFFAYTEAFASLVKLDFVSVNGALTTISALLKKKESQCAAITALGKTVELCGDQMLEKCDVTKMAELQSLVLGIKHDLYRYDIDYISSSLGWNQQSNGPLQQEQPQQQQQQQQQQAEVTMTTATQPTQQHHVTPPEPQQEQMKSPSAVTATPTAPQPASAQTLQTSAVSVATESQPSGLPQAPALAQQQWQSPAQQSLQHPAAVAGTAAGQMGSQVSAARVSPHPPQLQQHPSQQLPTQQLLPQQLPPQHLPPQQLPPQQTQPPPQQPQQQQHQQMVQQQQQLPQQQVQAQPQQQQLPQQPAQPPQQQQQPPFQQVPSPQVQQQQQASVPLPAGPTAGVGAPPISSVPKGLHALESYMGHNDMIYSIGYDEVQGQVVSSSRDGAVTVWGPKGEVVHSASFLAHNMCSLDCFSPQRSVFACGIPKVSNATSSGGGGGGGGAATPSGPCVVRLGSSPSNPSIWGEQSRMQRDHWELVTCLKVLKQGPECGIVTGEILRQHTVKAPDGTWATARVCYYDVGTGSAPLEGLEPLRSYYDHRGTVTCLSTYSPNPFVFLSGGVDCTVRVWDRRLATGVGVLGIPSPAAGGVVQSHDNMVTCIDADNTNLVLSGSVDSKLRLWDLRSLQNAGVSSFVMSLSLNDSPVIKAAIGHSVSSVAVSYSGGLFLVDFSSTPATATIAGAFADGRRQGRYHDLKWGSNRTILFAAGEEKRVDAYLLR